MHGLSYEEMEHDQTSYGVESFKLHHRQKSSILLKKSRVYCSKLLDQTGSFSEPTLTQQRFTHGCTRKFTIYL